MAYYPERPNVLVEGANYVGKSTIVRALRKHMTSATVVEHHDYYHSQAFPEVLRGEFSIGDLQKSSLPPEVIDELVGYNVGRVYRTINRISEEFRDPFFVERLHGTDIVYRKLLFDQNAWPDYISAEQMLNRDSAVLLVLTASDQTILSRLDNTDKVDRSSTSKDPVPDHVLSPDYALRKRDLYEEFFNTSKIERKYLVKTDNGVDIEKLLSSIFGSPIRIE